MELTIHRAIWGHKRSFGGKERVIALRGAGGGGLQPSPRSVRITFNLSPKRDSVH